MELSKEILRYRAIHGISQKEMAKRCRCSLQTIYSIENDLQTPSRVTEEKIRLVLDAQKGKEND